MPRPIVDVFAPHYCCSCGQIGAVLCEYCKYDIIQEAFERCIVCLKPVAGREALCKKCKVPYSSAWCVGDRSDALKAAIDAYKYDSKRAAVSDLVELLDSAVPRLPDDVIVVGVPTVSRHVRQRGYDHVALVARDFAKKRGLMTSKALKRVNDDVQQGSSRAERLVQAKWAFACDPVPNLPHLLIDDVYTTGATVQFASKALLDAGASEVYVAVLSRQPLEK